MEPKSTARATGGGGGSVTGSPSHNRKITRKVNPAISPLVAVLASESEGPLGGGNAGATDGGDDWSRAGVGLGRGVGGGVAEGVDDVGAVVPGDEEKVAKHAAAEGGADPAARDGARKLADELIGGAGGEGDTEGGLADGVLVALEDNASLRVGVGSGALGVDKGGRGESHEGEKRLELHVDGEIEVDE